MKEQGNPNIRTTDDFYEDLEPGEWPCNWVGLWLLALKTLGEADPTRLEERAQVLQEYAELFPDEPFETMCYLRNEPPPRPERVAAPDSISQPKPGRNQPCWCGSGKNTGCTI